MTISPETRRRYWPAWRRLVDQSWAAGNGMTPALPEMGHTGRESRNWIAPSEDRGETAMFAALGSMAYAYAKATTVSAREHLGPGLKAWAERAGQVLDGLEPRRAPPTLPFRADIDG